MIIQAIRSTVFYILFFAHTIPLAIFVGLLAHLAPRQTRLGWSVGQYWNSANLFMLRWIVGIRSDVSGAENIPDGGVIIAAKHMSDWDIFAILPHTDKPAFIAKRELLDIPFFGRAARWLNTISVDRKKGRQAFALMVEQARNALARGCEVIIFPEGTRKAPLEDPGYRTGLARMYVDLGVPVVPVALTSGLYWSRNSLILWPGTARARFLPAIEPGLSQAAFQERLIATIEAETGRMILEDARKGLARPISPRLRARLAALEAESEQTTPPAP